MDYNVIIVGGGYSGLEQANRLKENDSDNVLIVEFEAQIGGRPWANEDIPKARTETLTSTKVTNIEKNEKGFTVTLQNKNGQRKLTTKEVILTTGSVERERFFDFIPGDRPSGDYVPKLGLNLLRRGQAVGLQPIIVLSNEYAEELAENLNSYQEVDVRTISLDEYEIIEVKGTSRVSGVIVKSLETDEREEISGDAFIYANGIMPMTHSVLGLKIDLNDEKFVVTDADGRSSIEGLYAYGDCAIIK